MGPNLIEAAKNWPTPIVSDENTPQVDNNHDQDRGILRGVVIEWDANWPTPRVSSANGPSETELEDGNPKRRLETEASLWPTPNTRDTRRGCNQKQLATEVDKWQTPQARDYKGPNTGFQEMLPNQVQKWPTPTVAEADKIGNRPNYGQQGIEQSPGDSGLSRTGKDEQVEGRGCGLNEPRQMDDSENEGLQGRGLRDGFANPAYEMADPGCEGSQRIRWTQQEEPNKTPGTLPLYPPGPGDRDGWDRLLRQYPDLAPTFCKEGHDVQPEVQKTQSCIRRTPAGPLSGVDLRLRAVGNGVVPAVAALAFRTLARELKIEGLLYEKA